MTRNEQMHFELAVMDLAVAENCKTTEDYTRLAESLHESVENAIMDMCMDNGLDDYEPSYQGG